MAVVLVHQGPTVTQERYEEVVRKLSGGKSRMDSPSDWPVAGLLVHAAGRTPSSQPESPGCHELGLSTAAMRRQTGGCRHKPAQ